jgi:hypothetical protein
MTPTEASQLKWGDVVLRHLELYRFAAVLRGGMLIHLIGHTHDTTVPVRQVELVWRAAEVPPGTQLGYLTAEELARIDALISARKEREIGKEWR